MRNDKLLVIAAIAVVLFEILLVEFLHRGFGRGQLLRDEYAAAWSEYETAWTSLAGTSAEARTRLENCVVETHGSAACSRLNAAVERADALVVLIETDPECVTDEGERDRVVQATGEVRAVEQEILKQAGIVGRDASAAHSMWVADTLEPTLARAEVTITDARMAVAETEGQLADDGLRRQLITKTDELEDLVNQTRAQADQLTISEGTDVVTSLGVASGEVESTARAVREAHRLSQDGVTDVQGG